MSTGRAPRLSEAAVLRWARALARRTGRRPTQKSGPAAGAPGLCWAAVNQALARGQRGLPGGDSLARLLRRVLGPARDPLCRERILARAATHQDRTGRLPTLASGPVADAPGETWGALNAALRHGRRGLPGGGSQADFAGRVSRTSIDHCC